MSQHWPRVLISDVCESIVDCVNKTAPVVNSRTGYKMIRTSNVKKGWVDVQDVRYVDEHTFAKWTRRQVPKKGDIILTREAPLGEVGMLRSSDQVFLGQRLVSYRADKDKADNRFLLYSFQARDLQGQIRSLGSGATVEHMRVPDCMKLSLPLPPLPTQRRIAFILSTYDDLIENNARRITILEEMARRIYEEWFLHYRFPCHSSVRLVESELGLVPKGWDVISAADAIDINPKVRVPKENLKPFVPMGCLSEVNMLISDIEAREGNSGAKFQNGDTLFARITPCLENGKTAYVQFLSSRESVAFGSTEFIVLRSRNLTPEFVYLLARSDAFRNNAIKSMGGADGRQRVKEGCFASYMLARPDAAILEKFTSIVRPMFSMIHTLAGKNQNLLTARNLLLPRLISGELDVSTLPMSEDLAA